jgi:hypothetical protein
MGAQLSKINYSVSADCPACGAVTSFDQRGQLIVNGPYTHKGISYARVLYVFCQCARCGRGGLATIPDNGNLQPAALENFFPICNDAAPLPFAVPSDIQREFREAEQCLSFGANRAASALLRSVLEKILKANGYTKTNDSSLKTYKNESTRLLQMAL